MRTLPAWAFTLLCVAVAACVFLGAHLFGNDYVFFAGYTVVQYVVLATAWNILGGYTGYVNFGSAAFFALGAYTTVFIHKYQPLPIPVLVVLGALVSGLVGLGTGYLTLRLRGAFFAIATLALAVVLETLVVNWNYVGGSRGAYVIRPAEFAPLGIPYIQYLFLIVLALAVLSIVLARAIERAKLGCGFATIRDDELAAEASGVPTLRLKLIATTLSGALMGMVGAPFPYYIGYLQPSSAFALEYAVNSIAMPMIGGATMWAGPLIGAIILGTLQQIITVTISSAVNLLIVGALLVGFVIIAPNGSVGLVRDFLRAAAPARVDVRALAIVVVAAYCFIAGVLVVVFSLSLALNAERDALLLGSAGLAFAAFHIASAYGLLTLQRWGLVLAILVFVLSIALVVADLATGAKSISLWAEIAAIVLAAAASFFLLSGRVRELYRGHKLVALAAP